MYVLVCYLSYLVISIALTVWVARTLHRNGRVFLLDAFGGNDELTDSVNQLLVVGFYLINVGYIALALKTADPLNNAPDYRAGERKTGRGLHDPGRDALLQHPGVCEDAAARGACGSAAVAGSLGAG